LRSFFKSYSPITTNILGFNNTVPKKELLWEEGRVGKEGLMVSHSHISYPMNRNISSPKNISSSILTLFNEK
jgi:hypothetical protein